MATDPIVHPDEAAARTARMGLEAVDQIIGAMQHRPSVVVRGDFYFARCTCGIKTLGWQTPERAERALQQMHEAKKRIAEAAR